MLRIFLFGLSNRRKQPERYAKSILLEILVKKDKKVLTKPNMFGII
jgi:hypothetical protein